MVLHACAGPQRHHRAPECAVRGVGNPPGTRNLRRCPKEESILPSPSLRGCSSAWQDTVCLSVQDTPCHSSPWGQCPGRSLLPAGLTLCQEPSAAPALYRTCTGGGRRCQKGQVVLELVLSDDVLDAAVQENVLVLQERKGCQRQVSGRDLQITD